MSEKRRDNHNRILCKIEVDLFDHIVTNGGNYTVLEYVLLMRISNIDERHFYEIEAIWNEWRVKGAGEDSMIVHYINGWH